MIEAHHFSIEILLPSGGGFFVSALCQQQFSSDGSRARVHRQPISRRSTRARTRPMRTPRTTLPLLSPFLRLERITRIGLQPALIAPLLPREPSITCDGIPMDPITSAQALLVRGRRPLPTFRQPVLQGTARSSPRATTQASQALLWMYSDSPLALQSLSLDPQRARGNSVRASCIRSRSVPLRHRGRLLRRHSLGSTTKPDPFSLLLWQSSMNSLSASV